MRYRSPDREQDRASFRRVTKRESFVMGSMNRSLPQKGERERSLALAEIVRTSLQALDLLPTPRNYEIWYAYTLYSNRALNKDVDELLAGRGMPAEADLERLHDTYFGPGRALGKLETIGSGLSAQLGDVVELITGSLGSSSAYSDKLNCASRDLTVSVDAAAIRSTVQTLVAATLEMRQDGQRLKARLDGAMQEISDLQQGLQAIRMESRIDALTELGNRKQFDETIDAAIRGASQRAEPLSLLMIDIDHFKSFNDTHGHATGDQVLRLVATSLKQNIRGQDMAARYGGEEFAIVLPDTTLKQAVAAADNLRRAVMAKELKKRSTGEIIGRITISIGVASLLEIDTKESFIERADNFLYAAKRNGRNRVVGSEQLRDPIAQLA